VTLPNSMRLRVCEPFHDVDTEHSSPKNVEVSIVKEFFSLSLNWSVLVRRYAVHVHTRTVPCLVCLSLVSLSDIKHVMHFNLAGMLYDRRSSICRRRWSSNQKSMSTEEEWIPKARVVLLKARIPKNNGPLKSADCSRFESKNPPEH
jgi:hypothetical protein